MYSKLLNDINERVKNSTDRLSWARDVCRAASHFARQGEQQSALKTIDNVRQCFGNALEPEVACWLLLAEGMLHFFQERSIEAYDRFRGAYGLAIAFNAERARPTCAAWMAHIEFNESRFDSTIRFLEEALATAPADDHQARARACLILADFYHFCGTFTKARPWYEKARLHATAEGDGATMSAFLHNLAAFRVANVKLADAFGTKLPADAKQASMETSSAFNYDMAIGTASLQLLIPMMRGQILTVNGRFHEALIELASIKEKELPARFRASVLIDRAWCLVQLDIKEHIERCTKEAVDAITGDEDPDDRAYIFARLAKIQELLGAIYIPNCGELADKALDEHRKIQAAFEKKLDLLTADLANNSLAQ